jgi:hypothetical protein
MLEKYHKQRLPNKVRRQYEGINKTFNLKYKLNEDLDILYLSAFEKALEQKKKIEETYEAVRTDLFDMWDNLEFYERNKLIHTALLPIVEDFKVFNFEGVPIYIPFFDTLLNALYVKEVAILERPQFFDLYTSFKDRLIPLTTYGLDVLRYGFAYLKPIASNASTLVFFEPDINVFYKVNETGYKRYPISIKTELNSDNIVTLGDTLIEDEEKFLDVLIENNWIKPRCIKKILKVRAKNA